MAKERVCHYFARLRIKIQMARRRIATEEIVVYSFDSDRTSLSSRILRTFIGQFFSPSASSCLITMSLLELSVRDFPPVAALSPRLLI